MVDLLVQMLTQDIVVELFLKVNGPKQGYVKCFKEP
jgi:hypothetical protein